MFKTRLLSGILLVGFMLLAVIRGSFLLLGILYIISLIGMSELYKIFKVRKNLAGLAGYLITTIYFILLAMNKLDGFILLTIAFLMLLMLTYVISFPKFKTEQILAVFFGMFYVAVMLSYIYRVRMIDGGNFSVWLVFLSSWGCDTCAYCVGTLIGRHKMAPLLSPKKSVEGAIGGITGAALLGAVYGIGVNRWGDAGIGILSYSLICGVGGIISQIGDLAASAIKRNYEIKDYGRLIPGHGGILDRFDSVIFTAPVIYYMAVFLMQ